MSKKLNPVRPEALEGRTKETGPHIDALIDETLQDLTAGAPREGFRGRVLARIVAPPEPASIPGFEIFGWRVRAIQFATVGTLAAVALVALFVVPSLLHRGGSKPAETTVATLERTPPAIRQEPKVVPSAAAQEPGAASQPAQPRPRRPAIERAADSLQARAADEEPSTIARVKVNPLPDPDPIVNKAIDIKPVQIEELTIPEIQVRPLDGDRAKRDDK